MPIGTVYRAPARVQPPRKRSSTALPALSSETSATTPTSPTVPTSSSTQSDLEVRIAEFSNDNAPPTPDATAVQPTSPPPRPISQTSPAPAALSPRPHSTASASLPPKQPLSPANPYRQSATRASPSPVSELRSRPVSAPTPPLPAETSSSMATPQSTVPSANGSSRPQSAPQVAATDAEAAQAVAAGVMMTGKIMIVYYSMYGHVRLLADSVRQGIESVPGCSAEIFRVPETLGADILKKMNAPQKHNDPELTHDMLYKLREADGIMFGIPTRFGMMPTQMKAMFDSTVKLWTKGDLVGKPAGLFFSSATQGGGQETTALTTITQLAHHGMVFVPPGYSFGGAMFDNSEVHGGSPYGCGTIANGDGSRLPSKYELDFAKHQGAQFALVALKLAQ